MNALHVSEAEIARCKEDMLRELNLYPLWQLRSPLAARADGTVAEVAPDPVQLKAEQAAVSPTQNDETPQVDGAQTGIGNPVSSLGWRELRQRVKDCSACELRAGCLQTVFGMGDENADWLFVGSWPAEDDESKGEVFAGQAGQLLDNMLAAIKLKRGNNVYLANVVKCSGSIRRGPRPEQIAQCSAYLTRQIQLLQPKLIVALGHSAATALLGEDREWNSLLGKVHDFRGFAKDHGRETDGLQAAIPLIVTHHPAALLLSPLNKAQTWRDLCLARDTMSGLK